jgi:hypothetical protein
MKIPNTDISVEEVEFKRYMGISQKKENGQNKNPPQMKRMDTSYLKARTTK